MFYLPTCHGHLIKSKYWYQNLLHRQVDLVFYCKFIHILLLKKQGIRCTTYLQYKSWSSYNIQNVLVPFCYLNRNSC